MGETDTTDTRSSDSTSDSVGDSFTSNQQSEVVYQPVQHRARKGRKILDWQFQGQKPIWFLGDSNLFHNPPYTNEIIQIDSYPGAAFYHFQQILDETPEQPFVKIVVLSVGTNNRD